MAKKNYSKNITSTYRETTNLDTGVIVRTQTNVNTNYSSLTGSINLNYGGVMKWLFLFAMIVLFGSFAFQGSFSGVFEDNSITETVSVVDGYSYDVHYTYYSWTDKISKLGNIKPVFTINDFTNYENVVDLTDDVKASEILSILTFPIQLVAKILANIITFLEFLIYW